MISPIRRAKGTSRAISVVAVLALVLALLPAVPAMAGQVGNVSVTADNLEAGATDVNYTVAFDATGGLEPGDEIVVTFPTGYDVTGTTVTGIVYDGQPYEPAGTDKLGNIFRVGVPAELTVPAGGEVAVEFSDVGNPTEARTYQFAVKTTADTTTAYGTVTIEPADAERIVITEPADQSEFVVNQVVPIKLVIQDQYGNEAPLADETNVTFTLSSTTAAVYEDAAATQELEGGILTLAAGASRATVYLKETTEGSVTISVDNDKDLQDPSDITLAFAPFGEPVKLVFTEKPDQITAGGSGSFTLQVQDEFGNPVEASDAITVSLEVYGLQDPGKVTWGGEVTGGEGFTATGTIEANSSDLAFTFSSNEAAEGVKIAATAAGLEPAEATFDIVPAAASKLELSVADAYPGTPGIEIDSGKRASVTVAVYDQYGNPVPGALTVSLATSRSDTGSFYADETSEEAITQVNIPDTDYKVTVYYYDTLGEDDNWQEQVTLTASSEGLTAGTATVYLTGPRPETLLVEAEDSAEVYIRTPVTVRLVDQYGDPFAAGSDTTVSLTDDADGEFYLVPVGGSPVDEATLAEGQSELTVYYRPTAVGARTINVSATVTAYGQPFSIDGSKVVNVVPAGMTATRLEVVGGPFTAGERGSVTVMVVDQYGNDVSVAETVYVSLSTSSSAGRFYDAPSGGSEIASVTIPAGSSSATVYYYDEVAGTATLRATCANYDEGSTEVTVNPAAAASIRLSAPETLESGVPAEITAAVVDAFGNEVAQAAPLTLRLSTTSPDGYFKDASGNRITQATIEADASSVSFYYVDSRIGQATVTAATYGLDAGTAVIEVVAPAEPDTTPPGEVTNLGVSQTPGAGAFRISFTAPEDEDLVGVQVFVAVYGAEDWTPVVFDGSDTYSCDPGDDVALVVNLVGDFVLGKDRAQFKVVAVDTSGNKSEGVVADNSGQGYLVAAGYLLTPGPDGWRTFSVPVQLAGDQTLLGDVVTDLNKVKIAYKFDAASQQWVQVTEENNTIRPLEAVYVKLEAPVLAVIKPTTVPTNPPVRTLAEGWNLVGFTKRDDISSALYSVRGGWSAAVSPAVNEVPWVVTPENASGTTVRTHCGYWIYMDVPGGKLAGFSATPVTVGTYPY